MIVPDVPTLERKKYFWLDESLLDATTDGAISDGSVLCICQYVGCVQEQIRCLLCCGFSSLGTWLHTLTN